MKVIHKDELEADWVTDEDKKRISLLKVAPKGTYLKDIGIYDGTFFVVSEGQDDNMYLAFLSQTPNCGYHVRQTRGSNKMFTLAKKGDKVIICQLPR